MLGLGSLLGGLGEMGARWAGLGAGAWESLAVRIGWAGQPKVFWI